MSMSTLLLIILILLIFGGLPNLGYHNYSYGPSGILVVILLILLLMGRIP